MCEKTKLAGHWCFVGECFVVVIHYLCVSGVRYCMGGYYMNHGYKCTRCNHIAKEPAKRKRGGKTVFHCPACEYPNTMQKWEKPLNERVGRCDTCGNGEFKLIMKERRMLRGCPECGKWIDPETNKRIREGVKHGD